MGSPWALHFAAKKEGSTIVDHVKRSIAEDPADERLVLDGDDAEKSHWTGWH